MQYKEFGKTGEKLSILGFGAMRLPLIDNDDAKIDYAKAIAMVRYAIDNGVNYLDTAYPYHKGNSEAFCAAAMKDGYRDRINIATKSPTWLIKERKDFDEKLDEQLKNLEVEQIDFYLLHTLSAERMNAMKAADYKQFLDDAKKDGRIKYAGFSFHDDFAAFKDIVDSYDWDFCQIQLNYMDEEYQAGLKGLRYAHEKGIGVIVMEPLRGGTLVRDELPKEVTELFNSYDANRTPAHWALKYVWNYDEVGIVLSGMSTMEQVVENIEIASVSSSNSISKEELEIIGKVRDFYNSRMIVDCTNCKYCLPCPVGVDIPVNLAAYNHESIYDDFKRADMIINNWLKEEQRASNCVECGQCETQCPQNIEIIKHLKIIAEKYENK